MLRVLLIPTAVTFLRIILVLGGERKNFQSCIDFVVRWSARNSNLAVIVIFSCRAAAANQCDIVRDDIERERARFLSDAINAVSRLQHPHTAKHQDK